MGWRTEKKSTTPKTKKIQIQYNIYPANLSIYISRVNQKQWDFPDYSDCCPICGGKDCAVRHGYYSRSGRDEAGVFYSKIPIIRFLCRGNGPDKKIKDRTFSLLPLGLIPYQRYSVSFITNLLIFWLLLGHSLYDTLDHLSETPPHLLLSSSSLYAFKRLFVEALNRLYICPSVCSKLALTTSPSPLKTILKKIGDYIYQGINFYLKGPDALCFDFYFAQGAFLKNAPFLFGTPSQFRLKPS